MIAPSPEDAVELNGSFNRTSSSWVDYRLLESAFSSYMYYDDDLEQACSIFRGIAKNHAFSDGNKRTAAALLGMMLAQEGWFISPDALSKFTMDVVLHEYPIPNIAFQLRKLLQPV